MIFTQFHLIPLCPDFYSVPPYSLLKYLCFSGTEILTGKIEKKIVDIPNKNAADVPHIPSKTIDMIKKETHKE